MGHAASATVLDPVLLILSPNLRPTPGLQPWSVGSLRPATSAPLLHHVSIGRQSSAHSDP